MRSKTVAKPCTFRLTRKKIDRVNNMKKKIAVLFLISCIALLIIKMILFNEIVLSDRVCYLLNNSTYYNVTCIEEMNVGEAPTVVDIVQESDVSKIKKEIDRTTIKFKQRETGMEIDSPLYTLTVSADDIPLSITINAKNDIHFNIDETTYIVTNNSNLYSVLRDAFNNAMK